METNRTIMRIAPIVAALLISTSGCGGGSDVAATDAPAPPTTASSAETPDGGSGTRSSDAGSSSEDAEAEAEVIEGELVVITADEKKRELTLRDERAIFLNGLVGDDDRVVVHVQRTDKGRATQSLVSIDLTTAATAETDLIDHGVGILPVMGDGTVWAAQRPEGETNSPATDLIRLDAATLEVEGTHPTPGAEVIEGMAPVGGGLVVLTSNTGTARAKGEANLWFLRTVSPTGEYGDAVPIATKAAALNTGQVEETVGSAEILATGDGAHVVARLGKDAVVYDAADLAEVARWTDDRGINNFLLLDEELIVSKTTGNIEVWTRLSLPGLTDEEQFSADEVPAGIVIGDERWTWDSQVLTGRRID